ncbi:hypothetical protein CVT24_001071 [Panaeolus cyanescens]|uniref:Uncharacterized protein n=1 Tax=Panaeolus cyanescens TaxID=181874 RepID=A0A409W7R6_9AGAR|nr:hypothetical protein CVT24_001071 [Panaeolus cyanescens]
MFRRLYSTNVKSNHGSLYSQTFPAMIPVFLLGSAVFLGLKLTQSKFAHEKYLQEAHARIQVLEAEVDSLQQQRQIQLDSSSTSSAASAPNNKSEDKKSTRWFWS